MVLGPDRLFKLVVAAVEANPVAGDEGRNKEREPHDVVPVDVREKQVVRLRPAVPGEDRIAEGAQTTARVTHRPLRVTGVELNARGVAAERPGRLERQPRHHRIDRRIVPERDLAVTHRAQGRGDLGGDRRTVERRRQRSPRAPKVNPHGYSNLRLPAFLPRNFGSHRFGRSER